MSRARREAGGGEARSWPLGGQLRPPACDGGDGTGQAGLTPRGAGLEVIGREVVFFQGEFIVLRDGLYATTGEH